MPLGLILSTGKKGGKYRTKIRKTRSPNTNRTQMRSWAEEDSGVLVEQIFCMLHFSKNPSRNLAGVQYKNRNVYIEFFLSYLYKSARYTTKIQSFICVSPAY